MHYLLNDQSYYFPSSNDQTYPLQQFLQNLEHNFPIIVRISSSNIHERSIKHLLSRNIPLLLLTGYQFQSILSEYHPPNDGRHRLSITQGKLLPKKTTKFRTMRKLSKSLVTIATSNLREENNMDDNENSFNTRTIARNINEKRSNIVPLCRIPLSYSGYFEILNENDQAIEPVHQISDLLMIEYHNDEKNQQIRTEKWPQAFILRCQCQAYTKRYIPDEGKLSGSTDSCYGSLSDLDSQKTPLILNDNKETLQPGQILTILNSCFAYRSQISEQESKLDEYSLQSPTTSWLRTKSRFFFPRKKSQPTSNTSTKNIYDIPKISQTYLKCRTQQGDIVYISTDETGLFSPVYTPNRRSSSIVDLENIDVSGVFQLKQLLSNFRFPISVRLLNHSNTFDHIYSPSKTILSETSMISSTKFRLLLPYTEQVIFACPLIIPSAFKSHTIVIPIPIDSEIKVQRCLNMREIIQNKAYQELLGRCSEIINQYQNELSYIHFPLVLSSPTKRASARTEPLFKKRSQSESHIELHASDFNKEIHRKSCDILNYTEDQDDQQRLNLKTIRKNSSNEQDPIEKVVKQSSYYTKIKIDKPRKYLRQQELDSDDENYRELDHIYDYIRSGDLTDDVQKIQAKEQALNAKFNQTGNTSRVCVSAVLNVSNTAIKNSAKQLPSKCNSLEAMQVQKFPSNLDDSRPLDNGGGDDDDNDDPSRTRCSTSRQLSLHNLTDSSNSKPTLRMSRIN